MVRLISVLLLAAELPLPAVVGIGASSHPVRDIVQLKWWTNERSYTPRRGWTGKVPLETVWHVTRTATVVDEWLINETDVDQERGERSLGIVCEPGVSYWFDVWGELPDGQQIVRICSPVEFTLSLPDAPTATAVWAGPDRIEIRVQFP